MISYETYKVVHLLGVLLLFFSLGGVALHALNGGTRQGNVGRKLVAALHGAGTLVILVGGFGMLARLEIMHGLALPGWIWAKVTIWLILGGLVYLPYRKPQFARPAFVAVPLLGALAAYFAIYKPF